MTLFCRESPEELCFDEAVNISTRKKKPNKIAHGVSEERVQFLDEVLLEIKLKEMAWKSKIMLSKNIKNVFATDLMEKFSLSDQSLNTLCNKVNVSQSV